MCEYITLSNGMKLPKICYGPGIIHNEVIDIINIFNEWKIDKINQYYKDIKKNLTIRKVIKESEAKIFLDTASAYGKSELIIGKICSKFRNNVILCSKLAAGDQIRKGRNIINLYNESLKRMNIDKMDIYLMHWPVTKNYLDVWKQMEELYHQGKVGAIGVCNCHVHHLEEILAKCEMKPMICQIEMHPLLSQNEELMFCRQEGIQVMSYSPLARNDDRLANSRRLKLIAKRKGKSVSQIIIRWHIQRECIPVIATSNIKHYYENIEVFDFNLSERDMNAISGMNINSRIRYDSDNCDFMEL